MKLLVKIAARNIPIIYTIHTHHGISQFNIKRWVISHALQYIVKKIVFVADYSKIIFQNKFKYSNTKCQTIYNGLSTASIHSKITHSQSFTQSDLHITTVANLRRIKGYEYALNGLKLVIRSHANIKYHIIGKAPIVCSDQDISESISSYIMDKSLTNKIVLHGSQNNVIPFLRSSSIYLCSSLRELLPMSILEAMNCGLPIIATNVGGIPELLGKNNEYGILVPPKNPEAIAAAIESLINNSEKMYYYQQKSLERAKQFTSKEMAHKYLALFEEYSNK
jgi:glycosyltransferase involved in cell wall biosynthesis